MKNVVSIILSALLVVCITGCSSDISRSNADEFQDSAKPTSTPSASSNVPIPSSTAVNTPILKERRTVKNDEGLETILSAMPDIVKDLGKDASWEYNRDKDTLKYSFVLGHVSSEYFLEADHSPITKDIVALNSRLKETFSKVGLSDTKVICHISASDGPLLLVYTDSKETYCYDGTTDNLLENYLRPELYRAFDESPPPTTIKDSNSTLGNNNALLTANSYLNYSGFSRSGLIEQLEYEGYSHSESVYAVDNCGADWNHQAVRVAKSYIDYSGFSRQGLIEQLENEGFTHSQAEYGTDQSGADWYEQAVRVAKSYLNYSSFSRVELIDQLEYEGFTYNQATYGVSENGY